MIFAVVVSITFLFFVFAYLISPIIKKLIGYKLCAICSASSLTCLVLIFFKIFKIVNVDSAIISTLLGGSTVGVMYLLESYFKKKKLRHFWIIRVLEVPGGFFFAYSVSILNLKLILISIGYLLISVFAFFIIKNQSKLKAENKTNFSSNAVSNLEKNLENCC